MSWSSFNVSNQTIFLTARLTSDKLCYTNCSEEKCTPKKSEQDAGRSWNNKCNKCLTGDDDSVKCASYDGKCRINESCAVSYYVNPPNEFKCTENQLALSLYHGVSPGMESYSVFCTTCKYTCRTTGFCLYFDVRRSLDLGIAQAWTSSLQSDPDVPSRNPPIGEGGLQLAVRNPIPWDGIDYSKKFTGSVNSQWSFDLTNNPVTAEVVFNLGTWVNDWASGNSESTVTSIKQQVPSIAQYAIDTCCVLGIVAHVYDSFFDGNFKGNFFVTPFYSILDQSTFIYITHTRVPALCAYFDTSPDYSLKHVLSTLLLPPMPSQEIEGGEVTLTLHLSHKQALELITSEDSSEIVVNRYLANFLRDSSSTVQLPNSVVKPGGGCFVTIEKDLVNTDIFIKARMVHLGQGLITIDPNLVNVTTSTQSLHLNPTNSIESMVAAHYEVKVKVITWSIMLAAYVQTFSATTGTTFSPSLCNVIFPDQIPIIPRVCYDEAGKATQKEYIESSCRVRYRPVAGTTPESILLYADATDPYLGGKVCKCFNSNLGPPGVQELDEAGRNASRCFTVSCTEAQRVEEGLTDSKCSNENICDLVERWVSSDSPAEVGLDLVNFDWVRYALLCRKTIQPLSRVSYDWRIALAISGSLVSLVTFFAILLHRKRLGKIGYLFSIIGMLIVAIAIGVFSGWLFAGEPYCAGKGKPACRSTLMKALPLTQYSCPYVAKCECKQNQDCSVSGLCACSDGFCTKRSGIRGVTRKTSLKPNIDVLLFFACISITGPLIFSEVASLSGGIPKKSARVWIAICICFVLIAIGITLGIKDKKSLILNDENKGCGQPNIPNYALIGDPINLERAIAFPTQSLWTKNGTLDGYPIIQSPFELIPDAVDRVYDEIRDVYSDWSVDLIKRGFTVVANDNYYPSPSKYHIFQLEGGDSRGDSVVVSHALNETDDIFKVAWGNCDMDLSLIDTLPIEVSIEGGATPFKLYSYITDSKTVTGPSCVSKESSPELFEAAKDILPPLWDGIVTQKAIITTRAHVESAYIQISSGTATVCQLESGSWACGAPGNPSKDMSLYPCSV